MSLYKSLRDSGAFRDFEAFQDFEALRYLEREKLISIGIRRTTANKHWVKTSIAGKLFNVATLFILAFALYAFVYISWKIGVISLLVLPFHAWAVLETAAMIVKSDIISDLFSFTLFYISGDANIRINSTGQIIRHPLDWQIPIKEEYSKRCEEHNKDH